MIKERPFAIDEVFNEIYAYFLNFALPFQIFVRNMEFLAKHGPLRQLDHYGRHLNFIQYYLIDVIGALIG